MGVDNCNELLSVPGQAEFFCSGHGCIGWLSVCVELGNKLFTIPDLLGAVEGASEAIGCFVGLDVSGCYELLAVEGVARLSGLAYGAFNGLAVSVQCLDELFAVPHETSVEGGLECKVPV